MEDGTRLASPDLEMSFSRVMSFLKNHNALFEAAGEYLTFYQFWLGYRKQKQSFQSLDIIKVAYPWYSNASLYLNVSTYINPFLGECLTSGSMGSRGGYNCSTAAITDTRAVCEYRHCKTLSGKYCIFPFKIGGRVYDTCVPFGRADGTAWCGTSVDSSGNLLTNDTCASTCPVSTCPVGFMSILQTCIHIAAAHPYDTVQSVQEAENVCMTMGARLYQPRSMKSLRTLLFMNHPLFNSNFTIPNSLSNGLLGYDPDGNYIALGISGSQAYTFTYRDGSPFPDGLIPAIGYGFAWGSKCPDENVTNNCVVLQNKQEFANVPCSGYADGFAPGKKMSYVCEAKPFVTVDGLDPNKSCVFPFKVDASDVWHLSCIYGTNAKVRFLYSNTVGN